MRKPTLSFLESVGEELEQMDKDSGTISPIFSVVTGDVMPLSKTDEMLATQNWTLYFPVPGNHDLDAKHKVDSIAAHVRGMRRGISPSFTVDGRGECLPA
eukprot:scaffold439_cov415-Prasinococcus_capsulatus_cf.AAC.24